MSIIRYTLLVNEDVFSETDTFWHVKDNFEAVELISAEVVRPMQRRRAELGESTVSLVKVEILNPYVHIHKWKRTSIDRLNMRANYICERCGIAGHRFFNFVTGESHAVITRDPPHEKEKYELCKDPLKPMPKKMFFG